MQFLIKLAVSALIIATASTLSQKYKFVSALLISLPLTSIIAISFYYSGNKDVKEVINYTNSILFLVIPSLVFFIALPIFLRFELNFYISLIASCLITALSYYIFIRIFNLK